VLSWTYEICVWVTVQYVWSLSHCFIAIRFTNFAVCCVINNCFMFFFKYDFMFVFCFMCFFIFCVFCVFLYIFFIYLVYFLFVYNFTDHCHRVETQLHFINIISYHMSYHITSYHISYHIIYKDSVRILLKAKYVPTRKSRMFVLFRDVICVECQSHLKRTVWVKCAVP